MHQPQLLDLLDGVEVQTSRNSELSVYSSTADKKYNKLLMMSNVTSYSQRQVLHACPRKYQLSMHRAGDRTPALDAGSVNLDFTFGHAVGAGVQSYLLTRDLDKSLFNAFMAWRAPFADRKVKGSKS